ncbi:PEP-CTERM sorting domain-containing protein [Pseudoduganella lutea]|uniref:PEP-CTERM sorting domain-containing protein n=1 Tax=Pseudoduganella lutea TaxID=321985 RepID=UPI001E367AAA|nr:PEP-CTERM sorting domain-containing protein [Pseudoduganella lutea]
MQPISRGFALVTVFAMSLAFLPAAHAEQHLTTSGFTLAIAGSSSGSAEIDLLSDTGSTVRIALTGDPANTPVLAYSEDAPRENTVFGGVQLAGTVTEGYRITSLTLSGTLNASSEITPPDFECGINCFGRGGEAGNEATIAWTLTSAGISTTLPRLNVPYIEGSAPFALATNTHTTGDFTLDIQSTLFAYAAGTMYEITHFEGGSSWISYHSWPAWSALQLTDLVLTANVSAVPEPGTYGMLLAGLGVLGMRARRRVR